MAETEKLPAKPRGWDQLVLDRPKPKPPETIETNNLQSP